VALAIDGSTPAKATGTTTAITTAAFSPPANTQLVAFVARNVGFHNFNADGNVSSTGGLSWSLAGRKSVNAGSTGGAGTDGCTEIWVANTTTAPGSMTVTDTRGDGLSGSGAEHILKVEVFTGAESPWAGAITGTSSTSGLPSASVTTTQANSWVFASSSDWSAGGVGTVGSGQTMIDEDDVAGQYDAHIWRQTSTTSVSGTSVTMNLTAPSGQQYNELAIEIRETAATATDAGGRIQSGFHPGRGPTRARFYQTPKSYDVISAATINGTADLAGAGTLADVPVIQAAPATLTGAGTLSASGVIAGSATLTGAGTMAATVTQGAGSTLTGAGTVAAAVTESATASLTGAGTLAATVTESAIASLSGAGTLTSPVVQRVIATLTGAGVLTAQGGAGAVQGVASLTAAGTVTATATQAATATSTGAGALAANVIQRATVTATGAGGLTATVRQGATAAPAGAGTMSAVGAQAAPYVPILVGLDNSATGSGTLSGSSAGSGLEDNTATSGTIDGSSAPSSLDDTGAVSVSGLLG
jgi:hypothetical protein